MIVVAIIVLGYNALSRMGIDLYPNVDFPFVSIVTTYPGAGPEEIESKITKPVEDQVSLISGVKNVTSTSQEGISIVTLEFRIGTPLDAAVADVRSKVDAVRGTLPREVDAPIVAKADISGIPVFTCGLASPRPGKEVREIADNIISQRLARVPGVAQVGVAGGDVREILVAVDKGRLDAYGLSIAQVNQALQMENLNVPGGTLTEGKREYAVRAVGEFASLDDIRNVRLQTPSDASVKLSDIAEISDSVVDRAVVTRLNGQDAVTLSVLKQSGANTVAVVDGVKAELEQLTGQPLTRTSEKRKAARKKGILPSDITIASGYDQSTNIIETLSEVKTSLILGALLACVIVFLFLHNIRGTFIVALAIPTSILATFGPTYFAGFTLNMMVLLALSLSVGILVDDSIVVLENIWRHLRLGEAPREAALNGRTEIGLAAMTITLVDVVVFIPIAFMGGLVGQFFRQFGITVACATLFSLFVSFTLTPMLASRWFRKEDVAEGGEAEGTGTRQNRVFAAFDRFYAWLDQRYRRLLEWALGHRAATVITGAVILIGCLGISSGGASSVQSAGLFGAATIVLAALGLIFSRGSGRVAVGAAMIFALLAIGTPHRKLGNEMFPRTDSGDFSVTLEMPAGSSLEATTRVVEQMEDYLLDKKRFPEVKNVFATIGSSARGLVSFTGRDPTIANLEVVLVQKRERKRSDLEVMGAVTGWARKDLAGPQQVKSLVAGTIGGPAESPIQVALSGQDIGALVSASRQVVAVLKKIPGTKDVDTSWRAGRPEVQAQIDRVALSDRGLTAYAVANALRTSVEGSTDTKFREKGEEYDIRVRLRAPDRASARSIGQIAVSGGQGQTRLEDVARLRLASSPNKIDRHNRVRTVTVSSDVLPTTSEGELSPIIEKKVNSMNLQGVDSVELIGETQSRKESFGDIGAALGLSVVLIYILMAALFEGYLSPFIIMFSLPMAMVGALLALVLTGANQSIVSMVGIIMLMGLVTKNAILLVDYTNTLRARGVDRHAALLQAGPTRLRPIMMTTLAMIFGMLPAAAPGIFRLVSGSEWRAPMASAVIGGLLVSTLLTLVVIPVLYTVFDDLGLGFTRRLRAVLHRVFP